MKFDKKHNTNYIQRQWYGARHPGLHLLVLLLRVTKSKNFPDSKIFVAKTFRIKRVNRVNFQIRDKCA